MTGGRDHGVGGVFLRLRGVVRPNWIGDFGCVVAVKKIHRALRSLRFETRRGVLLVLLTAGCSTSPNDWTRPNTTMAQTEYDVERCKHEGVASAPQGPLGAQMKVFAACMKLAGYVPPVTHAAPNASADPRVINAHVPKKLQERPVSETFRDIKFGDKPKPAMVEVEVGDSGSIYKRPTDNLTVFGVRAEEILYVFERRGLFGVLVVYPPGTDEEVTAACVGLWGQPSKRVSETSVWWDGEDAAANLSRGKDGKVQLYLSNVD